MKSIRIILLFVILAGSLGLLSGCTSKSPEVEVTYIAEEFVRFVDIYVMAGNQFTLTGGIVPQGPILVFAGDRVIFNNMEKGKVTLTLPEGMFGDDRINENNEIVIEPDKRVILKVISEGDLSGIINGRVDPDGNTTDGSPNLKVGEEP
jgi:hypothetical protein